MARVMIAPVVSVCELAQEDRWFYRSGWGRKEVRKKVDAKVQGLARTKLGSRLLSGVAANSIEIEADAMPLGLVPCGQESWMNAVMQIVLRLPILRMFFSLLAPQSYEPFQIFMEQYEADRKARLAISSACSRSIACWLAQKLPLSSDTLHAQLFTIFKIFFGELLSTRPESYPFNEHCELLQYSPQQADLTSLIQGSSAVRLMSHALVFLSQTTGLSSLVPKQISDLEKGGYYDLQGFIERRADEGGLELIAYVKVAGKNWYQCRNRRIVKLPSIYLDVPLLSSCLLYYKRTATG